MRQHQLRNVQHVQQPYYTQQPTRADGAAYPVITRDHGRRKVWWWLIPLLIVGTCVAAYFPPLWFFVGTIWFFLFLFWAFISGNVWTFGGDDD